MWRYVEKYVLFLQQSRRERSGGKKRELADAREQRQIQQPWTTTPSHAETVTRSAVRGSASTATAGAAALPRTDIYGRKLHCLPRQTDAYPILSINYNCFYRKSWDVSPYDVKIQKLHCQYPHSCACCCRSECAWSERERQLSNQQKITL